MRSCDYSDNPIVAILIKDSYYDTAKLEQYYVDYLAHHNITDVMACELSYPSTGKLSVTAARKQILKLLPAFSHHGIQYLYVADATYFKALTGLSQADRHIGYVLPCKLKGFEHIQIVFGINYGQLLYNPTSATKLDFSLQTLVNHIQGNYQPLGDIIHKASYPSTDDEIDDALAYLHNYPTLACDIETTGLELGSQLYSIAFAYNQHEGVAFKVTDNQRLKRFFESYKGTLIFHNATFDIKHIIYNCFMSHARDFRGLLHGLHTLCSRVEDTMIIAYLATNNTQGNTLGLKELSQPFTGNYAIDVKDVLAHPLATVLEYNLKDTLATYWVYTQYKPKMLKDNQESIYHAIMLPSIKTIVQIELHGMPMNMDKVVQAKAQLLSQSQAALQSIYDNRHIKAVTHKLQKRELERINKNLKTKQHTMDKVKDYLFKPNSTAHLSYLLYDYLKMPVLDYTPNKQPAVGGKTLEKLINHTDEPDTVALLTALVEYAKAQKILSTFIPAFEKAQPKDNWHYLHGNFNLGGTLSNRLSSSNPNLQNLPSGSTFGKLVKQCFQAPDDWLFVGADFASLEDRINALLTKDSNKLKVYTDGYDGHCLRAYAYWGDKMSDIELADITDTCYHAKVGLSEIFWKSSDTINYQGKQYNGDDFYAMVAHQKL
ncbi:DNA polymerase [Moraxella marmotae]|uniref:DNA polymerase n=1 Tax=Moraxella marmotae TaxID=3344520 RepID=UPI0035F395F8